MSMMEAAATKALSKSLHLPPRTQLNQFPSNASALKLYEPAPPALTSMLATPLPHNFPTSVLIQEQRCESHAPLQILKEDKTWKLKATADRRQIGNEFSSHGEKVDMDSEQHLKESKSQLLCGPGLCDTTESSHAVKKPASSFTMLPVSCETEMLMDTEPRRELSVARNAHSASNLAASLPKNSESFGVDLDNSITPRLGSTTSDEIQTKKVKFVKSTRLLERRSRRKREPKLSGVLVHEPNSFRKPNSARKIINGSIGSNYFNLLLGKPAAQQLLTAEQERELILQVQALIKLEEVKSCFHAKFGREPTLVEWAGKVGHSCHSLLSQIHRGNRSREKLYFANLRLVVHAAKRYRESGLPMEDLIQAGSMGLMRSMKAFDPQAGTRFSTYSYNWIRMKIGKAIMLHSRIIRLPVPAYQLLKKVSEARRAFSREGNPCPTIDQLAARVGKSAKKIQQLLLAARKPISMETPMWTYPDTAHQEHVVELMEEYFPDVPEEDVRLLIDNLSQVDQGQPEVNAFLRETRLIENIGEPDPAPEERLMSEDVTNLLSILTPKESNIIRLRYALDGGRRVRLDEIGYALGVTRERVRQVEKKALKKLRSHCESKGLLSFAAWFG